MKRRWCGAEAGSGGRRLAGSTRQDAHSQPGSDWARLAGRSGNGRLPLLVAGGVAVREAGSVVVNAKVAVMTVWCELSEVLY